MPEFRRAEIGLRGISDGAHELRDYPNWTAHLGHIDEEMAKVIGGLGELLPPA